MDDVIVVGAGPAGNNVAFMLASLGYSVTVIDWRKAVGDKLCTGIVGRECEERFPMDRSLVYQDLRGARVITPGGETVEFGREGVQAHVVDRVGYVASFAQKAQEAGARYLLGHRVTDVSVDNGCAAVKVTDDVETRTMRGKVLVVASGFGSELTGQLGLGRVGDYVTGVQAEVMAPQIKDIHVYVGRQVAPGFFAWVVPTWGGRALVGLLSRQRGHGYLEKLLARLQMEGKVEGITKSPARWGIPLRPLGRTYGERVVVVGDAAGQVKPTTGGGIYYALRASEIAAETLHQALGHMDLSASRLKQYERGWRALLSQELEIGYSARRLFELLRDCQIDFAIHTVASNGISKELAESRTLSFDWHSEVVTKVLGHPALGKALTYLNPLLETLAPKNRGDSAGRPGRDSIFVEI